MKNKSSKVWAILWFITIVITVTIMILLHRGSEYTIIYKMSMGSFLWGQSLFFGYLVFADQIDKSSSNKMLPFHFASGIPVVIYCSAVCILGFLALGDVFSVNGFIVSQLLLLLGWLLIQGTLVSASQVVERNDADFSDSRSFYRTLQKDFSRVCMQVEATNDMALFQAFRDVNEEILRYGNPDSKPTVMHLEKDLAELVNKMLTISKNDANDSMQSLTQILNHFKQILILRNENLKNH